MEQNLNDTLAGIDLEGISNPYLADPVKGMRLVANLLSQEGLDEHDQLLKEIKCYLENEFIELVAKDAMPDEGVQIMNFYHACEQLAEAMRFPSLESKHVFAIGGGFSSGKSSFINVLLEQDVLPTDTRPTTSIPTLICLDEEQAMGVVNTFDKQVGLDEDALQAICHEFHTTYGLGFAGLLKHVLVTSPRFPFPFAAFLDTPGYSKADKGKDEELSDRMLAQRQLEGADFVIWLIDIGHGTIPQTDISFIKALDNDPELFFILTKADEKTDKDVESILEKTRNDIAAAGLHCAGILPFSSHDTDDYSLEALNDFVRNNSAVPKDCRIRKRFSDIFESYETYYEQAFDEGHDQLRLLNKIGLFPDLAEDDRPLVQRQINIVRNSIKITKELKPRLKEIKDKVLERVDRALISIEKARTDALATLDAVGLRRMHQVKQQNGDGDANQYLVDAALKGDEGALKELVMHVLYKDKFGWDDHGNTYLRKQLAILAKKERLPENISRGAIEKLQELTTHE
jgi:GTP-binding protein EngB required for normal cell division